MFDLKPFIIRQDWLCLFAACIKKQLLHLFLSTLLLFDMNWVAQFSTRALKIIRFTYKSKNIGFSIKYVELFFGRKIIQLSNAPGESTVTQVTSFLCIMYMHVYDNSFYDFWLKSSTYLCLIVTFYIKDPNKTGRPPRPRRPDDSRRRSKVRPNNQIILKK